MGRIQRTLTHETGDFCQAELWDNQNRAQHGTVSREPARYFSRGGESIIDNCAKRRN